jgi:archaellum component FlaC
MSETKAEKSTIIKLEEHQFQHLIITFSNISKELKNIAEKQERLESVIVKIEGELKLIRMEVSGLKEKQKNNSF